MKKLLAFLAVFMMFSTTVYAALVLEYDGGKHTYTGAVCKLEVNGELLEDLPLHPIIFNNRALVPVREVFEAMGAEVKYIAGSKEIIVSSDDAYIKMQIGSPYVYVNGLRHAIPDGVVPKLIAREGEYAKTMVPVRFVSETLGMIVDYDAANTLISITNPNQNDDEKDDDNTNSDQIKPDDTVKPNDPIKPDEPEITYSSTIDSMDITSDDTSVTVSLTLSEPAKKITNLQLSKGSVLYCDVYDTNFAVSHDVEVNEGPVLKVRLGLHDDYTRIAIDVDTDNVEDYFTTVSSGKTSIEITIIGDSAPTQNEDTGDTENTDNSGKIVVLDAGHGGSDPGAVYTHDDVTYKEKTINLAVAKKVKALLEKEGITVKMTRSGDTFPSLEERSEFANKQGAVMFVSIHSNSFPSNVDVNGIEVYYSRTNNSDSYGITSNKLASDIYNNLIKKTSATKRGVKTAQHLVTRTSNMPAVLIELGFITNKTEAMNLSSSKYQDLLAEAIAKAILNNIDSVEKPTAKTSVDVSEEKQNVEDETLDNVDTNKEQPEDED